LTDEMKKALAAIKDAYARENNITVWLEAYQEASVAYSKRIRLAEQRTKAIVTLLTKEYGIPEASIKSGKRKKGCEGCSGQGNGAVTSKQTLAVSKMLP